MNIHSRLVFCIIVMFFGFCSETTAGIKSQTIEFGDVSIEGDLTDYKLRLNGKKLLDIEGDYPSIELTYNIGDRDVILIGMSHGSSCPRTFIFVTVSFNGTVMRSESFGSCSDMPIILIDNESITVTTPGFRDGSASQKTVLKGEQLIVNGKATVLKTLGYYARKSDDKKAYMAENVSSAYRHIVSQAEKGDWATVYDFISLKSLGEFEWKLKLFSRISRLDPEVDQNITRKIVEIEELKGKDYFVGVIDLLNDKQDSFVVFGDVVKEQISGDEAILTVKNRQGKNVFVRMVKECGEWKLAAELK